MPTSEAAIVADLRRFFVHEVLEGDDSGFDEETHLLQSGLMNSRTIVSFVAFVEKTYGVVLSFKELDTENLKTVRTMAQMIMRATSEAG